MSTKRLCISLLHAPSRSQPQLPQCSLQSISTTARGDQHHRNNAQHHQQSRPFTLSHRHRAGGQMNPSRQARLRQPSQPSVAVAQKKQQKAALRDGSILDHYGMVPGTFVPPTGKNLPSWFSDWRGRWALEWHKLRYGIQLYLGALVIAKRTVKPKFALERSQVPGIAKDLYEDMYRHFAMGDLSPIEKKLSPGLVGSLRARISQRAANTSLQWSLERYLSQPKLVWFLVSVMDPKARSDEHTGIIQAVVQIRSRQRLQRVQRVMGRDPETGSRSVREVLVDSEGNAVPEDEMERERGRSTKDTTEYVVLQRLIRKSRPGPWFIWGTTEETTLPKLQKMNKQMQNLALAGGGQKA